MATDNSQTKRRRWNPQSQVNRNHLSHMVRGGTPGYFQTLAAGFAELAAGNQAAGLNELAPFLREDIESFLGGANKATLQAAKVAAADDARQDIFEKLIASGMDEAAAKEMAGL